MEKCLAYLLRGTRVALRCLVKRLEQLLPALLMRTPTKKFVEQYLNSLVVGDGACAVPLSFPPLVSAQNPFYRPESLQVPDIGRGGERRASVDGAVVFRGSRYILGLAGDIIGRMPVRVECYSGRKADERPVGFWLDERAFLVEEVLDQWYGPSDAFFKVRADDGNLYILRQSQSPSEDAWSLEAFRELKG